MAVVVVVVVGKRLREEQQDLDRQHRSQLTLVAVLECHLSCSADSHCCCCSSCCYWPLLELLRRKEIRVVGRRNSPLLPLLLPLSGRIVDRLIAVVVCLGFLAIVPDSTFDYRWSY